MHHGSAVTNRFVKAFDSLSWTFVNRTLSWFNIGPDIIQWYNLLYKDGESAVAQCGFFQIFLAKSGHLCFKSS